MNGLAKVFILFELASGRDAEFCCHTNLSPCGRPCVSVSAQQLEVLAGGKVVLRDSKVCRKQPAVLLLEGVFLAPPPQLHTNTLPIMRGLAKGHRSFCNGEGCRTRSLAIKPLAGRQQRLASA